LGSTIGIQAFFRPIQVKKMKRQRLVTGARPRLPLRTNREKYVKWWQGGAAAQPRFKSFPDGGAAAPPYHRAKSPLGLLSSVEIH
jgi:hypothetical protein